MTMRHLGFEPLAARRPAPQRRHISFGPGLVDEDQAGDQSAPDIWSIALGDEPRRNGPDWRQSGLFL
jgi:hypothetical protein